MDRTALRFYIAFLLFGLMLAFGCDEYLTRNATFNERWEPVIAHPLRHVSIARWGFCYPGQCRIV